MKHLRAVCVAILMLPTLMFAADDPLADVRDLLLAHRFKEAREQLVKARAAFVAQSNPAGEAVAMLLLGSVDSSLDDPAAARTELEAAAMKFVALEDDFSASMSLTALGQLERFQGQNDASVAAHERALGLLQKAADPKSKFSLATLKVLGPLDGMSIEMLGPLAEHPEIVKPLMLRVAEVMARDAYGAALLEVGALDKAEEQLTQASAAASLFGGLMDAPLAAHIGDLRQKQWRLDEARESYLKALNGGGAFRGTPLDDPRTELSILDKLAELEMLTGRVEEALAWNDRALTFARGLKEPKREWDVLEDRAELLQSAGRYDAAIALYEDLLKRAATTDDLFRQASIYSDLGALHMFQGTYGTAAKNLEKAIELYQRMKQPYIEAPIWLTLAEVHMQLGMQDSAAFDLENARELAKKSGFKLAGAMAELLATTNNFMDGRGSLGALDEAFKTWTELPETKGLPLDDDALGLFRTWIQVGAGLPAPLESQPAAIHGPPAFQVMPLIVHGLMLLKQGDHEGARAAWCQMLDTNPNNDIRAGLLGLIGASYWSEGNREEGLRYFTDAASTLKVSADDIKVEEMLAGYFGSNRHAYFDLLIDMLVHEDHWSEAFAQAERARARAFLQMVGNHRFNAERGADPRLVREAEILRTDIAAREREPGNAADLERARQRYRILLTRVKASNPEYESLTNVEPLKLEDVRAQLAPDTTLISYFVSPRIVHAWVVDRNQAHYMRLPIEPAGLQRIVCWADGFGRRGFRGVNVVGRCGGEAATAEDAFDLLIAPLLPAIANRKLIIVPHGVLHYVPFAALRNRKSEHYLIDDFTLTYAPSASALRFLSAKESPVDGNALVLGDPDTSLPRLPGAAKEATSVARLLGTTPHLGADARKALIDEAKGKCDLIHLAAHGIYDPVNPLFSRIALASDDTDDGGLTVREILSSVDLTGVNLVVLSACQSAVGARSGGDEVVGLTRALLYAGTPGVISTLWNIDDAASAGLMDEFYRRFTSGASVAEALRQAQLAVKANEQFKNPRYWAAFVLTGNPQGRWKHAE